MRENIRDQVIGCFEALGIIVDGNSNFELKEYVEDSLAFVLLISELESAFDIEIPDDFLIQDHLTTFDDVVSMVSQLL